MTDADEVFASSTARSASPAADRSFYVDLVANPEGNTNYVGEMANRIWDAVYRENCFGAPPQMGRAAPTGTAAGIFFVERDAAAAPAPAEHCAEETVFYRLLSGLHTSISTHIVARFHPQVDPSTKQPLLDARGRRVMAPNCAEFENRIVAHPEHVDNLYFLYQFVLRAVTRSADAYLTQGEGLATGDADLDSALRDKLSQLFHAKLLCSNTFNETRVLESPRAAALLPQMKRMMRNITTLMDCLPCEKCRVWGKLQTTGLVAAFKAVMAAPGQDRVGLKKNELVALLNFLRQLSYSLDAISTLPKTCEGRFAAAPSTTGIGSGDDL